LEFGHPENAGVAAAAGTGGGGGDTDAFWADLERRFRELQIEDDRKAVRIGHFMIASWRSNGGWPATGELWDLNGGTQALRTKFEWLAERAAIRLGHGGGRYAVFFWLDRLRAESPNYRIAGELPVGDGDVAVIGDVDRVCEASADYCIKCATQETARLRAIVSAIASPVVRGTGAQQTTEARGESPVGPPLPPKGAVDTPVGVRDPNASPKVSQSAVAGDAVEEVMGRLRPHDTFPEFLDCIAPLAGREQMDILSRGPDAQHLWMLRGLPTFREFQTTAGREALRKVWDSLPTLRTQGKGAIQKVLAADWSGRFPEDNSAIIADAIWSCILLHGDRPKRNSEEPGAAEKPKSQTENKGDPALLAGEVRVTFRTAERYLGITERQRQNLVRQGVLVVEGQGLNRRITTESLRKYLPTENPK
jgi:hypothetical protein